MLRRLLVFVGVLAATRCATQKSSENGSDGKTEGSFRAEYGAAQKDYQAFRTGLIANRFLDTIAARLNDSLRIPQDITLATAHCDEPNASYSPEGHRVTLCYELAKYLTERYVNRVGGEFVVTGTLVFALMHELGHALVDVLQLPVTGREEDAVDQLAIILLLNQGPSGDSLAFGAGGWFSINARSGKLDDLAFADDHGLDRQRVYNLICWIYGRDPNRYPEVIHDGWLPENRAQRCPTEYLRMQRSWAQLLAPYRRGPTPRRN